MPAGAPYLRMTANDAELRKQADQFATGKISANVLLLIKLAKVTIASQGPQSRACRRQAC
jgi:hypothetical protein